MEQNPSVMTDFQSALEDQLNVRVAWLYFMEGRTQAEIAEQLSTNRLRINRIINEARRSGLVSITINSHLASCVELERELATQFGLKRAVVIPTPRDAGQLPDLLGRATADYVTSLLSAGKVSGIGVGWGATLREVVRHMPAMRRPELCVNSVMGGLTRGIEINTFDIASDLARRLSAECTYLAAPIYSGSPESRDAIIKELFSEGFERIASNDLILLSIGDLTERSLLVRYGLPKDVSVEEIAQAGACGDILAQFIDRSGRAIDHPINRRAIALSLDALRDIPNVVIASGGRHKVEPIAAVLLSGIASALICDEETARLALFEALQRRESLERR